MVKRGDKLVPIQNLLWMKDNPVVCRSFKCLDDGEFSVYPTKEGIGNETIAFKIAVKE